MKEAQITCTCQSIRIPDLDVTLKSGDLIWINEQDYRQSRDVKHALSIGAIGVQWKERCRVAKQRPKQPKQPAPPAYQGLSAPRKAVVKEVVERVIIQEKVDTDRLGKQMKAALVGEVSRHMGVLKDLIAVEVKKALAEKGDTDPKELLAMVEATMKAIVANLPKTQVTQEKIAQHEDPLYIPTGIVNTRAKGKVDVQVAASENPDMDDALKALKKRKKQNGDI